MEANSEHLDQLRILLGRIKDLQAAASVLEWDQETYMPEGAANARARQVATLRRLAHEYFTDEEIGTLLVKLRREINGADPTEDHVALVNICSRDLKRPRKFHRILFRNYHMLYLLEKKHGKEQEKTILFRLLPLTWRN